MAILFVAGACSDRTASGTNAPAAGDQGPPQWRFEAVDHGLANTVLTDVWGRSDGAMFAVGWYGVILSNRITPGNPLSGWRVMPTPTSATP